MMVRYSGVISSLSGSFVCCCVVTPGVDIELPGVQRRVDLRRRVLTPRECDSLGGVAGVTEQEEVLLRFSVKEAVYKAAHPFLHRPLGFKDVSAFFGAFVTPVVTRFKLLPDTTVFDCCCCVWNLAGGYWGESSSRVLRCKERVGGVDEHSDSSKRRIYSWYVLRSLDTSCTQLIVYLH